MVDLNLLMQYLLQGDILGFFQALYVAAFQSVDLFYGVMVLLFTVPLYIRTHSLLLLCILWILLGGTVVAIMPLASGLAVFLLILGIGGTLYKLWTSVHA